MKLTDISIEGFEGIRHVNLNQLSPGLNVVLSHNMSDQTALRDFVTAILYGYHPFQNNVHQELHGDLPSNVNAAWPSGHLKIQSGGNHYRLTRSFSTSYGGLSISDVAGNSLGHRTPDILASLDPSAYCHFFNFDLAESNWSREPFVSDLVSRFELHSVATPFNSDIQSYEQWKNAADQRQTRLETLRRELDRMHGQRTKLLGELGSLQHRHQDGLDEIEKKLDALLAEMRGLKNRLDNDNLRISEIDRLINELMLRIDHGQTNLQHVPVSRPHPDRLAMLYQRLDEIDGQIRRWRTVQKDIQGQRIRLRDEMTSSSELSIESSDHPYHNAREILIALEGKVDRTESFAKTWNELNNPLEESRQLIHLCSEMRGDLYALCQELGRQYKHVRHKAAIAELKQLRRCYHEMDENVSHLLLRRDAVIEEIRDVDPIGADAVVRADLQFCECAELDGYLEARKRFVDNQLLPAENPHEYRTIYPDLTLEREQLAQLQKERTELKEHISACEIRLQQMGQRQIVLQNERSTLVSRGENQFEQQIRDCDLRIEDLDNQVRTLQSQVEDDRRFYGWKPNYLLNDATRYLQTLSHGSWQQIWFDVGQSIHVKSRTGKSHSSQSLDRHAQLCIRLCLTLAALDQFALRGIRLPVVIQFDDPATTIAEGLLPAVEAFGRNGHQVILITGNRLIAESARKINAAVFELADTNITVPTWYPEAPAVRRPSSTGPAAAGESFVFNKYAINRKEFNTLASATPPLSVPPLPAPLTPTTERITERITSVTPAVQLRDVDLVESIYLNSLERNGIRTVGHLLDLEIENLNPALIQNGFTMDQLDRWQAQALLLVSLPELTPGDAKVLVGCGITDPEIILHAPETELLDRTRNYFESSAGRRAVASNHRFDQARMRRLSDWLRNHSSWQRFTRNRRPRASYTFNQTEYTHNQNGSTDRLTPSTNHGSRRLHYSDDLLTDSSDNDHSTRAAQVSPTQAAPDFKSATGASDKYRFFLELTDNIEAAPSIGAKTAERLMTVGVQTIEDFLCSAPEEIAKSIDNRRMTAKVLRTWQAQTRLMCCVPNLRNHDAQLLVACGVSAADDLAGMEPEKLLGIVEPFAKTKEGTRILRTGKKPDLAEVSLWIDSANHRRQLQAA